MSLNKNVRKTGLAVWGLLFAAATLFAAPEAFAAGDAKKGEAIYQKRCWWCHGKKGAADGPAAKFLIPPPRDFTLGMYKYKSSEPKVEIPRDEDLFKIVTNGMPGTGMPAWNDILNDQDRWDVVAYIKSLTDMFGKAPNPPRKQSPLSENL